MRETGFGYPGLGLTSLLKGHDRIDSIRIDLLSLSNLRRSSISRFRPPVGGGRRERRSVWQGGDEKVGGRRHDNCMEGACSLE